MPSALKVLFKSIFSYSKLTVVFPYTLSIKFIVLLLQLFFNSSPVHHICGMMQRFNIFFLYSKLFLSLSSDISPFFLQ